VAALPGFNTVISLDNSAGTPVDISAICDTVGSLDLTKASIDTTAFGDTATKFVAGMGQSPAVSVSGPYDKTLVDGVVAAQGALRTLKVSFGGGGPGTPYVSGECLIQGVSLSTSASGRVDWSGTLQVTGGLSTGTN
jgi:hypothetical protein